MNPADDLAVWKKVLLHLSRFSHYQQAAVFPFEMTQDGIAEKLGKSTGNVSVQLSRLAEFGCVESKVDHVEGAKTRRRVYLITSKGQMIAENIRESERRQQKKGRSDLGQAGRHLAEDSVLKLARGAIEDEKTDSASTYTYSFMIGV